MDRKEWLRQYRIKTREHRLEYQRERRHKMRKLCPHCSQPIGNEATLCKSCWAKSRVGKRSFNWKGGTSKRQDGYIMVYMPEHPRASRGYVLEHIAIWEKYNGKILPDGWHIHHLNGMRSDNRPVNLKALSSHKHALIIAEKAKRIQELEGLLKNQNHLL